MKQYLLGIDIGTSACKVALFRRDGTCVASASAGYEVYYPHEGWAEQDPEDFWTAAAAATRCVMQKSGVDPHEIAGIGVDGQSWSAIAIDKGGRVLTRTPIWMDTRAASICEELSLRIGEERIFSLTGNPLKPSYTTAKILWYKRHLPEIYGQIDKILQSNGFIVYRLTGKISMDLSQGYGLHCFDMRCGAWDASMCEALGIPMRMLPPLYPCDAVVGVVTPEAAEACGLCAGIPVVAGGLDAACGTLGAGVTEHGETQEQGGQAGGMSICLDRYVAHPALILSHHVVPGRWLLQGGTTGGGGVMRWLERELSGAERTAAEKNGTSILSELDATAADSPAGSRGVVFLPYMAGERSPIWDEKAKGVFYGLGFSTSRGDMIRAAMEGVAYSLRHNLEVAAKAGAEVSVLRAMGGASNSLLWTQIKADVTGRRMEVVASDTATVLGAALLAGVGTGMYRDYAEATGAIHVRRIHEPDPALSAVYHKGYGIYRALYEQLRDLMRG